MILYPVNCHEIVHGHGLSVLPSGRATISPWILLTEINVAVKYRLFQLCQRECAVTAASIKHAANF